MIISMLYQKSYEQSERQAGKRRENPHGESRGFELRSIYYSSLGEEEIRKTFYHCFNIHIATYPKKILFI